MCRPLVCLPPELRCVAPWCVCPLSCGVSLQVWGGCSSHNGMTYVRGHPLDYDRWAAEGATGWDYAHVLPYFRKSQTHELGEDQYRGGEGPTYVSR